MGFDAMYEGTPPWDVPVPQPAYVRIAEEGGIRGEVLDAGCGTGENALFLAARGHAVLGIDASPRAIAKARARAKARGLSAEFLVHDALDLALLGRSFDTAIDSGLFHVFDDVDRGRYVAGLRAALRPGGRAFVLCFSDREPPGWGPRRVPRAELAEAFGSGWEVEWIREARFAHLLPGGGAEAWIGAFRRV